MLEAALLDCIQGLPGQALIDDLRHALEISEFRDMIAQGAGPERSGYLSAFFTLVGTHGLHVSAGLVWLLVMFGQIASKGLTGPVRSRLFRFSLFWHFLDLMWVGIFSIVYLLGVM